MDEVLRALNAAGYHVAFTPCPDGLREGQGNGPASAYAAAIFTVAHLSGHEIHGRWEARGATPWAALQAAGFKLHNTMRPVYESYITLADAFNWALDEGAEGAAQEGADGAAGQP